MKVYGLHCDVRVKGVLVEHDSATSEMSNVKVAREALVQKGTQSLLEQHSRAIFTAMCSSMAPSLPRRSPGFQLKMLRRACSSKRLGAWLSKGCSSLREKFLQSWASRKTGLALPEVPKYKISKFV